MVAPKVLVTGRGGAGSWEIRGRQIGKAMGAVVKPNATLEDLRSVDVALVVKRAPDELLTNLRRSGVPWVYDIVDAYPQPECTAWSAEKSIRWLRNHIDRLNPNTTIFATERMRVDSSRDGVTVYHHARPGQKINPIRESISTVGYEGSPQYIGKWAEAIKLPFVVNPANLADVDVVIAVRDAQWYGYAQQHWKSNVKLANAHATGTPFIGLSECGYAETSTGGERLIGSSEQLDLALHMIASQAHRQQVAEMFVAATRTVEQAATETKNVLWSILR